MIINGYNFSKYPIIKVPSFCVKRKASSKKIVSITMQHCIKIVEKTYKIMLHNMLFLKIKE